LDGAATVRGLFGMPSPMTPTLPLMAREQVEQSCVHGSARVPSGTLAPDTCGESFRDIPVERV
jgi:hypothetical protein